MLRKIGLVLLNFIYKILYKKPFIMNDNDTVDYIIKNNCSITRFGDGEINLILGNDIIWFQKYSKEIKDKLIEVANINNDKLLVCIPKEIVNDTLDNYTIWAKKFWKKHRLLVGGFYNKYFNKQQMVGDASISRFYLGKDNKNEINNFVIKLKHIWNDRDLLIVEGYNSKLGIDNDLLDNSKSIRRIICPNKNAFNSYDKIIQSVNRNYHRGDLVLLALGPTATILAADLSIKHNIQTLDLGHIDIEYMWYKNKDDHKTIIKNKNTAELVTLEYDENGITEGTIDIIK